MIRGRNKYGWSCAERSQRRWLDTPITRGLANACRGLVNAAPWTDMVLIIIFLVVLASRQILQPGMIVELPTTTVPSGTQRGLTAVVQFHEGAGDGRREEMVFFDDDPFAVGAPTDMDALKQRFAAVALDHPGAPLVIEADVRVQYGTIASLCTMAREAGMAEVNLAEYLSAEDSND